MASLSWWNLQKIWHYAFRRDPLSQKGDERNLPSAGVPQQGAFGMADIRGDNAGGDQGLVRLSNSSNEMVDMSAISDRKNRYKEYERLRNVPEIENCMTVFSDEACFHGSTKVATLFGFPNIKWLSENRKDDRFMVYSWDHALEDYTLAWAYDPRMVGVRETVRIRLDNGTCFTCTPDHKVLLRDGSWSAAADLKFGAHLMPFYKVPPRTDLTKAKTNQFPRIFTFRDGWIHERSFVDKWRTGRSDPKQDHLQKAIRLFSSGLKIKEVADLMEHEERTIHDLFKRYGYDHKELKILGGLLDYRRVCGIHPEKQVEVYDLSVEDHRCFATDSVILHNCQKGDNGHICKITADDHEVKDEAEWFAYNLIDVDRHGWNWFKQDIIAGDGFYEMVLNAENPKDGIARVVRLPQEYMFRIETIKGRLVEFQQSPDGPDYEALSKVDVTQASEADLLQSKAIRFTPEQIVHNRHGEDRSTFYPYGQSLIEPARGPAHCLRMLEDAMLVYRLCLAGNTRVRTPDGHKLMKDLRPGDTVFSFTRERKSVPTKVIDFIENGIKEVFRVRSQHVEIIGTANHPILVESNGVAGYVDIRDIRPGIDHFLIAGEEDQATPSSEAIIDISPFGSEPVFDITVESEEHNFIANGVPVHNSRAPERRVFYIDIGTIAGARAEAFIDRMKDQFKKRKTTGRGHGIGANAVEERWHAPSADEDYWIPVRPQSNTRVETLPGASHLGDIDDVELFRQKLYIALNFPKNYYSQDDVQQTRITLSSNDVRFARTVERLQMSFERGLWEMITRHLFLRGYPEESYEDLVVKMTPPSDWRELSRAEVKANRLNEATTMKSSQLYSDFDIYTKVFQHTEDEAKSLQSRMKVQKMDDLKIQIIASNPQLLGVGLPGDGQPEMGTEAGGPAPDLLGGAPPPGGAPGPPMGGAPPPPPQGMLKYMDAKDAGGSDPGAQQQGGGALVDSPDETTGGGTPLPDASPEDIKKYGMEIEDYSGTMDAEDIDYSEL